MAHEITFAWQLDVTLFAAIFKNDAGTYKVNIAGGDTWEAWNDVNVDDYDIPLTERGGGGMYTSTFPVIAAGVYFIVIYQGSALDGSDPPVGGNEVYWNGSSAINISSGVNLASTGLDNISAAEPDALATTFRGKLMQLFSRWYGRKVKFTVTAPGEGRIDTYESGGADVAVTQDVTETEAVQTVDAGANP